MNMIDCKLLSGTEDNPIEVVVNASSAFATISWAYEVTVEQESCFSSTSIANHSETIGIMPLECGKSGETSSTLAWNNLTVYYHIVQKEEECPITCEDKPKITNKLIDDRVWVTPYDVYCNRDNKEIKLHYEYYQTTEYCGKVKKEKIIKNVPITLSNDECNCSDSSSIVSSSYTADEQFEIEGGTTDKIDYKYNCIVSSGSKCGCNKFSFDDDTCNCDKFSFDDEQCKCSSFKFEDDQCSCANDFDFNV